MPRWFAEIPTHVTQTVIVTAATRKEAAEKVRNRGQHWEDIEPLDAVDTWSGVGRIVREYKEET